MKRLIATIEIARPHNMLAAAVAVAGGYFLSGGRAFGEIATPLVFTALVTGFGNLINDFYDAEIDRVNKPRRPIPSGKLSPRFVFRAYVTGNALVTVGMLLLLPASPTTQASSTGRTWCKHPTQTATSRRSLSALAIVLIPSMVVARQAISST